VTGSVAERRPHAPLALVVAVTVTGIMANALLAPTIPDILAEFDQDDARSGLLVATVSVSGVVLAPLVGILADRHGRRLVLVPCLTLFGIAGLAVAAAPTFQLVLLARFIQGAGSAGLINLSVILIGDRFEGAELTRYLGRNSAVITVSLGTMPLFAGVVSDAVGWRWALVPYGLGIITAAAAWLALADDRPIRDSNGSAPGIGAQFVQMFGLLRLQGFGPLVLSGWAVFVVIFGLFLAVLPVHLDVLFGLDGTARGAVLAAPAITSTIAAGNLVRVRTRLGRSRTLMVASLVFAVSFLAIAGAPTVWLVVAGAACYGFGEGVMVPSLQNAAVDLSPPDQRGAGVSLLVGWSRLGQTMGPLGAGALVGWTNTRWPFVVGATLMGLVALLHARKLLPDVPVDPPPR